MIETLKAAYGRARHPWRITLFGALLWALVIAASVWVELTWQSAYGFRSQKIEVTLLYAAGALLAFPPALFCGRFVSAKPGAWRMIAIAGLLTVATLGFTALVLALEYRMYYAEWHAPAFSKLWFWQQLFTTAGAVAQFAVIGVRFYFPFVPIALVATALWANRLAH